MLSTQSDIVRPQPFVTGSIELERGNAEPSAHPENIDGRASVIDGGTLSIRGAAISLAGIEAPALKHPCEKESGRAWNCGAYARAALRKLVRGKAVTCALSGREADGQAIGTCVVDGVDVGEYLVRNGHVFATSGFMARYGTIESEARQAKVGIWQGRAPRPDQWRQGLWAEAKSRAPDGCPIKGLVRSQRSKMYTMPWSERYEGVRLQTTRGDKWFCSEDEARAAGFKPDNRS